MLEAERAVVGALLDSQNESWVSELEDEDFYDQDCRHAFSAIRQILDEGGEVSNTAVSERSGVVSETLELFSSKGKGVTEGQLKTLVADLQRCGALRATFNACEKAIAKVSKDASLEDVLGPLELSLFRSDRQGASEAKDGSEVMQRVLQQFLDKVKNGAKDEISTGIKELDRAIIGLRPGKMFVVAARPSMGKTALADTIRRSVLAQGYGVIQFNLEMSAEEILERELAYQSQTNLRKILAAKDLSEDDIQRIGSVAGTAVGGRWFIDDRTYSIAGIKRRSRLLAGRMARSGIKVGLVILDYIQLAGENGDGREQSVAAISRGCKLLAKELGCTVMALSQLNRSCENREDRRPMMSDLRESGSIEQDADIVSFVYREHMYNTEHPPEDTELIIRKHRSGPTGTVKLHYNPKICNFEDIKVDGPVVH